MARTRISCQTESMYSNVRNGGLAAFVTLLFVAAGCSSEVATASQHEALTQKACPGVDLGKDVENCGACGNACSYSGEDGEAVCDDGRCNVRCFGGTILIGGRCIWEAE